MPSLMFSADPSDDPSWLTRTSLAARDSTKDEKWLQEVLFANPSLIPIQEVSPGTQSFVPICRELTIPKYSSSVFLDLFGVTPEGRLVLVECKLWRNPQARREVVAQVLEYASLMRAWSFGDLTARVKAATGSLSGNPLYALVAQSHPEIEEAAFVDAITKSLSTGDFILIIAGDGIRSDVHAIADHLNQSSGLAARLALVEFQLWENQRGDLIIIPAVPVRSELIQHRVLVDQLGRPLKVEQVEPDDEGAERIMDPEAAATKAADRAFWQRFIDNAEFDHPDQPPARHGGVGWVRLPMPEPANWMTAFRTKQGTAGLFLRLKGAAGANVVAEIEGALPRLETEVGAPLRIEIKGSGSAGNLNAFEATIAADYDGDPWLEDNFLAWLVKTSNLMVSALRPMFSQMAHERGGI